MSALQSASGGTFRFAIVPGFHLNGGNYPSSGSNQLNHVSFLLPYTYYYSFPYPNGAPPMIDITYTV